jgi:hypothetical protein
MYYAFTLMDYPIIKILAGKDKLDTPLAEPAYKLRIKP